VEERSLKIVEKKMEYMVVATDLDIANFSQIIEKRKKVHNFKYLSSNMRYDGTVDYEINQRI
jgi:hypothetical protein